MKVTCQESIFPIPSARRSVRTAILPRASFRAIWSRVISTRCDGRSPPTPGSGSPRPSTSAAAPPAASPADALRGLLDLIPGRPWIEATLEAAPGTITPDNARAWVDAGINRVSLGVQSFVDRRNPPHRPQALRRRSSPAKSPCSATPASRNINIDLIAGLSAQTEASWRESLDWIERLAPEHVSVYMLEVDEDSRLGKEMLLGGVRYGAADTPSEDETAAFYEIAVERLAALGIPRYEISNFARPGHESRHNLKYWTLEPYVGFGADAHSFDGRTRRQNPESVEDYRRPASAAPDACAHRTTSASSSASACRPASARLPPNGRRYARAHRAASSTPACSNPRDGVLRLTDRGVLLSNEVFQEFLTA